MSQFDNYLFSEGDLKDALDNFVRQISKKVDAIQKDQFLSTPEQDTVEHLYAELSITPLTIYEDSKEMEQAEVKIDVSGQRYFNPSRRSGPINVPGVRIIVSLPYSGDSDLWKARPDRRESVIPRGDIHLPKGDKPGYIELKYEQRLDEPPEQIQKMLQGDLNSIKYLLEAQKRLIKEYNDSLPRHIERAVQNRRGRLKQHDGIAEMLGIPIKRRDGVPAVKNIPIERKLVKPLPAPPKSGFKAEPGISSEDYEYILSIIKHEGRTFETTPKTYSVHGEEGLRDIMLAHLNGHLRGGATGETFRKSGKTDIRIEDNERAAFVAECKVWEGPSKFNSAIDQLLGYLTWRDCKAAIVIFNKHNAKFSEILDKVPDIVQGHVLFKRDLGQQRDGEWRYVFQSPDDEARQIIVNIMIFNIYVA